MFALYSLANPPAVLFTTFPTSPFKEIDSWDCFWKAYLVWYFTVFLFHLLTELCSGFIDSKLSSCNYCLSGFQYNLFYTSCIDINKRRKICHAWAPRPQNAISSTPVFAHFFLRPPIHLNVLCICPHFPSFHPGAKFIVPDWGYIVDSAGGPVRQPCAYPPCQGLWTMNCTRL